MPAAVPIAAPATPKPTPVAIAIPCQCAPEVVMGASSPISAGAIVTPRGYSLVCFAISRPLRGVVAGGSVMMGYGVVLPFFNGRVVPDIRPGFGVVPLAMTGAIVDFFELGLAGVAG